MQRGGSGGGTAVIMRGNSSECKSRGTKSVMCKDTYRPEIAHGMFARDNAWETCKTEGARFADESQCETGACAEKCQASQVCQDAMNVEAADASALKKAWVACNGCKMSCMAKTPPSKDACQAECPSKMLELCPEMAECVETSSGSGIGPLRKCGR